MFTSYSQVIGREVLIHFIYKLCAGYGQDTDITELLDNSRVHILVSMNPDGFEEAYYAHGGTEGNCTGTQLQGRYSRTTSWMTFCISLPLYKLI